MNVRRAQPEDAPAIAEVEAKAARQPWSVDSIAKHLALASTEAWVWESAFIEAHLLTSKAADVAEVLTIAVLPQARRQGIGRALLRAAEAEWTSGATAEAFLEVRADNAGAKALYIGQGWVQVGERSRYYRDGCDAHILRWSQP